MLKKFERWQVVDKAVAENAPLKRKLQAEARRKKIAERRDSEIQRRKRNERHLYICRTVELEMGVEAMAAKLDVEPTTIKRWLDGKTRVPGAVIIALEALQGRLPGMDTKAWNGAWINRDGTIGLSNTKATYRPEQIYMLEWCLNMMTNSRDDAWREAKALQVKLAEAQRQIDRLEAGYAPRPKAANDAEHPREREAPKRWYKSLGWKRQA